jgi:hypothetical protein
MLMSRRLIAVVSSLWLLSSQAADLPSPVVVAPQSQRLVRLLADLDGKDPATLEAFWKEIERNHTPLVEDIPNQPHDALYTFLVQADPEDDAMNCRDITMSTSNNPFLTG